jgi:hypothetical protein
MPARPQYLYSVDDLCCAAHFVVKECGNMNRYLVVGGGAAEIVDAPNIDILARLTRHWDHVAIWRVAESYPDHRDNVPQLLSHELAQRDGFPDIY